MQSAEQDAAVRQGLKHLVVDIGPLEAAAAGGKLMRIPSLSMAGVQADSKPAKMHASRKQAKNRRNPELEYGFGARLRAARISAGMSQTALGAAVGISFQQVQKYEKGFDRMAASTLQGFATALGVHPGSFYDDIPFPSGSIPEVKTAMKIAEISQRIESQSVLKQITGLMEAVAAPTSGAKRARSP